MAHQLHGSSGDNPNYSESEAERDGVRYNSSLQRIMGMGWNKRVKTPSSRRIMYGIVAILVVILLGLFIILIATWKPSCESPIHVANDADVSDLEAIVDIAILTVPVNITEPIHITENQTTTPASPTATPSTTTTTTETTTTSTSTEPPSTTPSPRDLMRGAYKNFTERFNRTFTEDGLDNYVANSAFFTEEIATHGETQFADLSVDLLRKLLTTQQDSMREDTGNRCDIHVYYGDDDQKQDENIVGSNLYMANDRIPSRIDLRRRGIVGDVRNQGTKCNGGYAFAVTTLLESKVDTNGSRLSVQQLLVDHHNHHCEGGETFRAMETAELEGLVTADVLPYDQNQEWHDFEGNTTSYRYKHACLLSGSHRNGERYWDREYRYRKENVVSASTYITHFLSKIGTVLVEVPVDHSFFFYRSGAYSPDCTAILGFQPAVVVGYGMRNGINVWILRNSFGTEWGIDGDFEMARDSSCGTFDYAFSFYDKV